MKLTRPLAALALLVASALPALAADAVYPPGLRLGMVPLVGLSTAKTFPGFESEDGNVKVLITELPPAACTWWWPSVSAWATSGARQRRASSS